MTAPLRPIDEEDLERIHSIVTTHRWSGLGGAHVLLTGGTGFVGKWLLSAIVDADRRQALNCRVSVLTRDPAAFALAAPHLARAHNVQLLAGDVRDFDGNGQTFSHVVHAATDVVAQASPLDTFDTCLTGTRRVLDTALASRANVLLLSSGAVYGRQPPSLDALSESYTGAPDTLKPASAYGEGKRAAEWLGSAYAGEHGLRVMSARCFAFVGPYLPLDKHFAIGNFLRDAMSGNPIVIQGDGTPYRSYLHAADLAAWLWCILLSGRTQTAYNVGGDEAVSIAQLAHRVVKALGSSSEIRILKAPVVGAAAERYVPDVNLVRSEFELPAPLALDVAVQRTSRWHQTVNAP